MGHMPLVDQYDLMVEKIRAYWVQEVPDAPFPEVFLAGSRILLGLRGNQDATAQAQILHASIKHWEAAERWAYPKTSHPSTQRLRPVAERHGTAKDPW